MALPKRILAAVDFSSQSPTIVDHACELAELATAQLHILTVDPQIDGSNNESPVARGLLEQLGRLIRPADELDIETRKVVRGGQPHRAIVDYAKTNDIDLIVIGTHGRTGLSHLALGSVAERVMRHATCPVQVVKRQQLEDNRLDLAAEALVEKLGETLSGTFAETESQAISTIETAMKLTRSAATDILEQLKQNEWAVWTPEEAGSSQGAWQFVTGVDFIEDASEFRAAESNSPATDLVIRARKLRATDIHVDPTSNNESRIRLRIDGQLEEYCRLDRSVAEHLVNQWKLMSGLDVAEPFLPKEGRVVFPESATELADAEARFTSAPVAAGESVALRLFNRSDLYIPLSALGLSETAMFAVEEMLRDSEGLVLVSGPTGSGKTTTVYSMLESISSANRNIVSIEDPVEFPVPFVRQMAVDERHGIDMTKGLKTLLRMDPDVIFLGEIRDALAADIAMQAAASGRYVFSTLHTRDIASVFTTLRDFGVTDRSLAANLSGVANQRLMRRLCNHCRREASVTDELKVRCESLSIESPSVQYERVGCTRCRGTGYFGRIGIFEALRFTPSFREAISDGRPESDLRSLMIEAGLVTLEKDALVKVVEGTTDFDELNRVHWV